MKFKICLYSIIQVCLLLLFSSYLCADNIIGRLTNLNGLSNNSINCIYQDSEGIMWFGTWDGLNSYNGRDFKTYRYSNKEFSISNNIIRQIIESDPMHLWIATDYGVNRWNRQTQNFDNYFLDAQDLKPKREKSYQICLTNNKTVLAFIYGQGLFYYQSDKKEFVKVANSTSVNDVKKMIVDKNDQLYILYNNGGLDRYSINYKKDTIGLSKKTIIENDNSILNIFYTNNLLILNYKEYIKSLDDNNLYPTSIDVDTKKTISDILYDENHFLISYLEGGCDSYDLKSHRYESLQNFPQNISVFSMYLGTQDILWIGTDGQGVFQIHAYDSFFESVRTDHPVRSFSQLSNNEILVGTKGDGLKLYNKQSKQLRYYASQKDGLISNSVYAMKKNAQGDIFIGTEGKGINVLSSNRLYTLLLPNSSPVFQSVYSIEFTNNGQCVWLGTSGFGLIKIDLIKDGNRYSASGVKQYASSNNSSKNDDIIYSVIRGNTDNELWIGTRLGGVYRFDVDTEKFQNIEEIDNHLKITNNDVLCLMKNANSLWVGTGYGLNRIVKEDSKKYTVKTRFEDVGFANNSTIHGLLLYQDKDVWISTNDGLYNIDLINKTTFNYSIKDGLQNNEFSDGAYYQDVENTFYFGGVNGFNYFHPNEINLREFDPTITLSHLRIFNTPYNIYDKIKNNTLNLDYGEAYITLSFLAQDYIRNENCEYAYRLLDLSEEWIDNDENPNIVLTNLSPGKHKLQVKVTNGDGKWGSNVYQLYIHVAYPWWLSLPAIIIYCILIILITYIIYSVIKNRIILNRQLLLEHIEKENQKKMHESKLNFFTNVAHEFFTPLTLIYGPAQHLLEKADIDTYTKRYIQVIKNNADRMQKLINELMEFRKVESGHTPLHPEKIDVSVLIGYISDNYTEIAEQNKISFQIETHNVSTFVTDRNSIEKIIFNLISNAFKYTPINGYINIDISQIDDNLNFKIRNSGNGLTQKQMSQIFNQFKIFDTSTKVENSRSTGIGLSLVRGLVDLLGGNITVSSELLEYVQFEFTVPSLHIAENEQEEVQESTITSMSTIVQERKDISILIVEDERNIRELLRDILEPYYNINEACDGKEAYDMIMKNTPDLIISDILMPHLNGIQLIDKLRANTKTAHIPIINISAKTSLDDRVEAYQQGSDLYITKPFHPRHILATVQNLINRNAQLKTYFTSSLSSITVKDGLEIHHEDENLLKEIVSYIEQNIDDENLNPNTMADALGLSKATLYRKLKELSDKTPSEFVRNIRLNYAAQLLISTKSTVQEIMFKSGFSNKSYFYREFAKQYNLSPNEYRQKNTK